MKAKRAKKVVGITVLTRIEVFAEGAQFIGLCPDLNVSSFGDTEEEARRSTREALGLFFEQCREMKTLEDVLGDAGYSSGADGTWRPREPLLVERIKVEAA